MKSADANSIIHQGHTSHTGPVFPATGPDGKWGDVIPPFDYSGGHYPGLNWTTEGQAVLNGGCDVDLTQPPEEIPTTTTTATASTTTTTIGGTTTTTSGSATSSSTASSTTSSATTVTTFPVTPPTVAPQPDPPPLTDPPGQEIMPEVEAIVIDQGNRTVVLGSLNEPQRIWLEEQVDQGLAFTGSKSAVPVSAIGILLVVSGAGLMAAAAQRRLRIGRRSNR